MPSLFDRLAPKTSSKLTTPNRPPSQGRSPVTSPQNPKIVLPIDTSGTNSLNGSVIMAPRVVLTNDENSSPMSVTTPGSLHRADSATHGGLLPEPKSEAKKKKSSGQLSISSHRRYATSPPASHVIEADLPTPTPQRPNPSENLATYDVGSVNGGSRSRTSSSVSAQEQGTAFQQPLNDSPTQSVSSHRSGSISSSEAAGMVYQPLQLVESPTRDTHAQHGRARSTSAISSEREDEVGLIVPAKEVTKRKSWRSATSGVTEPAANLFQLATSPSMLGGKKPPTRHQTTMGMGIANALAASGMGIVPPSHVTMSPSAGPASLPNGRTRASSASSGSPIQHRRRVAGREPSSTSTSTAGQGRNGPGDSGESGSDDDDYDSGDALDFGDDDIPVTGFAVATMKRNQDFHDLFPTVPVDDYLIDDYGCALQRDILIQGRLYISENHMCFNANLFGWITSVIIPFSQVTAIEKKMTAFVIPNAIGVTEQSGSKHTFASFLARDTAYEVVHNIWKHSRPEGAVSASGHGDGPAGEEGLGLSTNGLNSTGATTVAGAAGAGRRKATVCACSKDGSHYPSIALEAVFSGTPQQVYGLMFQSGFIKDFMVKDQRLMDIQISDWQPSSDNAKLLSRNMSYIKPLSGGFGPKQTKCELRDETQHVDFDDYISSITTTRTPEVPSGSVFSVKTRTCLMWAGASSTKVTVSYTIEWTGRSFVKGIIEKSAGDGQLTYYKELEAAMRKYIAENRKEFLPEGVDPTEADQEAEVEEAALSPTTAQKEEESSSEPRVPSSRGLQWALDTFEGASKVAKDSFTGALDIISDSMTGFDYSRTTFLLVAIVILVLSNIYTVISLGEREEAGRLRAIEKKNGEKERWVGEAVRAFLEVQQSIGVPVGVPSPIQVYPPVETQELQDAEAEPTPAINPTDSTIWESKEQVKAELKELLKVADELEQRVAKLKIQLEELD